MIFARRGPGETGSEAKNPGLVDAGAGGAFTRNNRNPQAFRARAIVFAATARARHGQEAGKILKPASRKCASVVKASVIFSSFITTKLVQSVKE